MRDEVVRQISDDADPPEPRWPALIAVLLAGGLYAALPASLAVGPRWLELVLICLLSLPTVIT